MYQVCILKEWRRADCLRFSLSLLACKENLGGGFLGEGAFFLDFNYFGVGNIFEGGCRYWSEKCTGIWDFYELLPVLYECTYFHIPVHLYAPLILSQSHPACLVSLLFEMEEGPWRGWGWGTIANESLTLNQHLGFS